MLITLDSTSETPLYVQLRNQIVLAIGRGDLARGEGLPTVRQLAQDAGVNFMTVNKAYTILKNEGFIEIDRRRGARVSPRLNGDTAAYQEKLEAELCLLIAESGLKGIEEPAFLALCARLYAQMPGMARRREEGAG